MATTPLSLGGFAKAKPASKLSLMDANSMNGWGTPAAGVLPQPALGGGIGGTPGSQYLNVDPAFTGPAASNVKVPEMGGGWMSGIGTGLQVANVGLGVYNAMEQSKMNDFMKGYYGDQMNLKKADFANAAKDTNANLEQRQMNRLSAQGHTFDSQSNKQGTADYMSKWGVKETY